MPQLYFAGHIVELSEQKFLRLLDRRAGGTHGIARSFCTSHNSGFADIDGRDEYWIQTPLDHLKTLIPQIDDEELRELFRTLYLLTQKRYERDRQIIDVMAKIVDLPPPQAKKDRQKLKRKLRKYEQYGPGWTIEAPVFFQQVGQDARQDGVALDELEQQIGERVKQLLAVTPDDVEENLSPLAAIIPKMPFQVRRFIPRNEWDSNQLQQLTEQSNIFQQFTETADTFEEGEVLQARELIDRAYEELDTKQAINLLREALDFGHSSIQAGRAYLYLAMRYEDLDDKFQAIECYTKAMEAGQPSAGLLFWRGMLHYRLEQWAEARSDFKQILAFSSDQDLFSVERELTEKFLAELDFFENISFVPLPLDDTIPASTEKEKFISQRDRSSTQPVASQPVVEEDKNALEREATILAELGDQRAKDLIDRAIEGPHDTESTIRILRGALRFGHTGIQASKAHLHLAIIYEESDDKSKAIEHYTKSIEAWKPSAGIFFSRGLLYYQLGKREEARSDFEQALAFPPEEGLTPPGREQVEKYLAELDESSEET